MSNRIRWLITVTDPKDEEWANKKSRLDGGAQKFQEYQKKFYSEDLNARSEEAEILEDDVRERCEDDDESLKEVVECENWENYLIEVKHLRMIKTSTLVEGSGRMC